MVGNAHTYFIHSFLFGRVCKLGTFYLYWSLPPGVEAAPILESVAVLSMFYTQIHIRNCDQGSMAIKAICSNLCTDFEYLVLILTTLRHHMA